MNDHRRHHNQQQHLRLSLPASTPISRLYPPSSPFPFSPSSISTPSKRRHSNSPSISSLFLLLFSLRSLYSLLPFIRSTPSSFSLFPFSFLVSLLSFSLSLFPFSPSDTLFKTLISTPSILRPLAAKSTLLTLVFLLRFQALRYCGTSATILADLSGSLFAKSFSQIDRTSSRRVSRIRGFSALVVALVQASFYLIAGIESVAPPSHPPLLLRPRDAIVYYPCFSLSFPVSSDSTRNHLPIGVL